MSNYRSRLLLATLGALASAAYASDHLDTPTVIADPAADIGDIYAWVSDSKLNLVMDIVSAKFSDRLRYSFHIDSGKRLGATTVRTNIDCTFDVANRVDCRAGNDRVRGDASNTTGLLSERRHLRVFAGVRDDPFFNNVRGTRAALDVAGAAMKAGLARDAAGCPQFDAPTVARIADEWRHTEGHAATNLLAGWKTAALVISVDLDVVTRGGSRLGVWATVSHDGETLDRMGRALTGNALLGTFDTADASNRRKEQYNRAPSDGWAAFAPDIAINLANYDGFDGQCGNQWLAVQNTTDPTRYDALARLLADDRLWVNADARVCKQYLAAEFDFVGALNDDCGGRTPTYDAVDVFRSLLANGTTSGITDGVDHDEREPSDSRFPFLAAP